MTYDNHYPFPHHRLDWYQLALELAVACDALAGRIPRGYAKITDNLKRASAGVPLRVGEGANRCTDGQKRQRFTEARGECGESAVGLEVALRLKLVPPEEAVAALQLAGRTGATLTGLIHRFR